MAVGQWDAVAEKVSPAGGGQTTRATAGWPLAGFRCGVASLVGSVLSFMLCAWATAMLARFSPVFTPIRCVGGQQAFDTPVINATGVFVAAGMQMACHNPNPYPLQVFESAPGRVMLWPQREDIGSVSVSPVTMAAHSAAAMPATVVLHFPMTTAIALLSTPTTGVVLEIKMRGTAEVGFFVGSASVTRDQPATCGFSMKTELPMSAGPAACYRNTEELVPHIPAADSTERVAFEFGPDPAELAPAATSLHTALGFLVAVSGTAGLALAAWAVLVLRRSRKPTISECPDVEAPTPQVAASSRAV